MSDLASLLEKVKSAKGGDREIDCLLALAVDGFFEVPPRYDGDVVGYGYDDSDGNPIHPGYGGDQIVPKYTASVDRALALVERKLPGWVIDHMGADAVGSPMDMRTIGWTVELGFGNQLVIAGYQGQAPTLPLAILAAMLTALISQETTNGN